MFRVFSLLAVLVATATVNAQTVTFDGRVQYGWEQFQEMDIDRITAVPSPDYPSLPQIVTRFEVDPGDRVNGWTGERAERAIMVGPSGPIIEGVASGEQYFAWSIYLNGWTSPLPDPSGNGVWGTPLQLHGPDVFSNAPPVSLSLTTNYKLVLGGGDVSPPHVWLAKSYLFSDGGAPRPYRWDDFVIGVKFARDSGWVKVWRRETGDHLAIVAQADNVPTLAYSLAYEAAHPGDPAAQRHYWKQGFYRSASAGVKTVLFQTGVVRASTFTDAATLAFGASRAQ